MLVMLQASQLCDHLVSIPLVNQEPLSHTTEAHLSCVLKIVFFKEHLIYRYTCTQGLVCWPIGISNSWPNRPIKKRERKSRCAGKYHLPFLNWKKLINESSQLCSLRRFFIINLSPSGTIWYESQRHGWTLISLSKGRMIRLLMECKKGPEWNC